MVTHVYTCTSGRRRKTLDVFPARLQPEHKHNAGVMGAPSTTMNPPPAFDMRSFEVSLLLGDADALLALGFPISAAIVRGDLAPALRSPAAVAALSGASPPASPEGALLEKYEAGVALLLAFIRDNWGGPRETSTPPHADDESAAVSLAVDGEDVAASVRSARYIAAARRLLIDGLPGMLEAGCALAPWWGARVALAHHSVLSAPTPSLQREVFGLFGRFLGQAAAATRDVFADVAPREEVTAEKEEEEWEMPTMDGIEDEEDDFVCVLPCDEPSAEEGPLAVLARIELALAQKAFYDAEGAAESIRRATEMAGVEIEVSGEMGMRTKYQSKATAQLIARAFWGGGVGAAGDGGRDGVTGLRTVFPTHADETGGVSGCIPLPKNVPSNDSDVLGYIKLVDQPPDGDKAEGKEEKGAEIDHLTPMDQALVLAHASIVGARQSAHFLTDQQMSPFVNLVLSNASSPHGTSSLVQMKALLLRVSFESERGRFLERCMSQMEAVSAFIDDDMSAADAGVRNFAIAERSLFAFASGSPPRWEVKKQLAVSLGNMGLVKSAMEIFEELGFWDELVDCHRLVGNLGAAEGLIQSQMGVLDKEVVKAEDALRDASAETKTVAEEALSRAKAVRFSRRPRLLCVLGDVRRNPSLLEQAWTESGNRYTRAQRALGRLAVDTGRWSDAVAHFRSALAINPLYPDVWFSYGCAAMELQDPKTAAEAFTQVIRQTPNLGEGWNNLGRALVELGRKKEALGALSEGARVLRDSWRVWDNVLTLATELRSTAVALGAMDRLFDLRGRDAEFGRALRVAVDDVVHATGKTGKDEREEAAGLCRRLLGVLQKATEIDATNAGVWEACARVHELTPDGTKEAFDARLKQMRVIVAQAEWSRDQKGLREMALASVELCRVAEAVGDADSIRKAQMHVESVVEQARKDFEEDAAFLRIVEAKGEIDDAWRTGGFREADGTSPSA